MKQKKLVPMRRFEGYTAEWQRRSFSEEIELYSGLTYSPNDVKKKGTLVLRSSNVQNGEIVNADNVYVNSEVVNSSNVREGDIIVVVRNGSRSLIGKHAQIKVKMDKAVIGAFMTGIRSRQSNFINALLDTQNFKDEVDKNLGATINQITNGMFNSMSFLFPDTQEQQKVGQFFKLLDKRIVNQERKISKVKALKSAYLTEMFPQEGETVPKRRFEGFDGEWQENRLEDIVEITMGHSPSSANYTNNPTDHILVQGNADIKNNRVSPRVWTTQVTTTAKRNDLILTVRAPVGEVGKTDYDVVLGRGVAGIKGNEFIFQLLIKMKDEGYWNHLSTGSTFDSINSNDIKGVIILTPNLQEQQKIGQFFKNLDDQIRTEERKLDKLKAMKEAYLEEMFV